jgi:hypothetical protein
MPSSPLSHHQKYLSEHFQRGLIIIIITIIIIVGLLSSREGEIEKKGTLLPKRRPARNSLIINLLLSHIMMCLSSICFGP